MRRRAFLTLLAVALYADGAAGESDLSAAAQRVKTAHVHLMSAPSDPTAQRAYLAAFPSDFAAFRAMFMPKDFKQLYDGHDYVFALSDIGKALPEETFAKMLGIEATAKWDADAVNYLQHVTITLAQQQPKAFVSRFNALSQSEQRGVVTFLADGPHRPTASLIELTAQLEKGGYKAVAKQLREAAELRRARGEH